MAITLLGVGGGGTKSRILRCLDYFNFCDFGTAGTISHFYNILIEG